MKNQITLGVNGASLVENFSVRAILALSSPTNKTL